MQVALTLPGLSNLRVTLKIVKGAPEAWEGRGLFYPGSSHAGGFTGVKSSGESKDGANSIGLQIFVQRTAKIDLKLEGWELVRRTVEGWYQAADELVGIRISVMAPNALLLGRMSSMCLLLIANMIR